MASDMLRASAWRRLMPCCERPAAWKVYSNGHGHLLERKDRVAAQVARGVAHRKIEVAHVVERLGGMLVGEVVILQLGTNVE